MTEQQILDEITELEHAREEFVKQVNQEAAFRDGEINALKRLLEKMRAATHENAGPPSSEAEQPSSAGEPTTAQAPDMAQSASPATGAEGTPHSGQE